MVEWCESEKGISLDVNWPPYGYFGTKKKQRFFLYPFVIVALSTNPVKSTSQNIVKYLIVGIVLLMLMHASPVYAMK